LKYVYTSDNRLETPINYSYAEFGGVEFLAAYIQDRQQAMARIGQPLRDLSATEISQWLQRELLSAASGQPNGARDGAAILRSLQIEQPIDTAHLLDCLLGSQLADAREPAITPWVDRLVQRFEVTKKLYAGYRPGFRTGEGDIGCVPLYLTLALVLCLRYHADGQLKYLSTLLKLTDLLCSLPADSYAAGNLAVRLGLLVGAEVASVRALANLKSVRIAA
jgi:hypothetical protein